MSLKGVAKETLGIIERGYYDHADAGRIELAGDIAAAVTGTVLHRPAELGELVAPRSPAQRVEFAVHDKSAERANLRAFQRQFG